MAIPFSRRHPPIPGYEPQRQLGENGAIVYVAWSSCAGKQVALQVWDRSFSARRPDSTFVGLEHPNILCVLEVGEVDGYAYVAREYLEEAESLDVRLRRGPLAETEARSLAMIVAVVLLFVRAKGVAVAPVTPGDLLLGKTPKVVLRSPNALYARPHFIAPEELYGPQDDVTAAIDVYRVGALLYAMLSARPPVAWHLAQTGVPERLPLRQVNHAVSTKLEKVCMKCLEEAPIDRFSSLAELIGAIDDSK